MIILPDRQTGIAGMANVSGLLGPHAAASLSFRIKNILVTGQAAQVDPAFRRFYFPWNIGFLIATILLLLSCINVTRGNMTVAFVVDGVFMLAAFFGLPLALGWAKWRGMFVWQPDAVYWCLVAGSLLFVKLIGRTIWIIRHAH